MWRSALSFLFLPIFLFVQADVVTCGGFITASSRLSEAFDVKLDYSIVKMHLFTQDGLLKYSTECAPNGYYFIPVYDQGSFYLEIEGPEGWTFEPKQHAFSITSQNDACSDDINFRFTGFSLSGSVRNEGGMECALPDQGPGGIQVTLFAVQVPSELHSQMNSGSTFSAQIWNSFKKQQIATTVSEKGGQFQFNNVFPGPYVVQVEHKTWSLLDTEQFIHMKWGNAELPQPFRVLGYAIQGQVQSSGEAVAGVDIFLYSDKWNEKTQRSFSCPQPPPSAIAPAQRGKLLCFTQSASNGHFSFKDIPCGKYTIVPSYKRSHTTFDVKPDELAVSLEHGDLKLSRSFEVLGFSVTGRVVDRAGNGISGATIFVNDVEKATSDDNGQYKLDRIQTGKYAIRATKEHLVFHELKNVQLSPSVSVLPDVTVIKYALCGEVDSGAEGSEQATRQVTVAGTSNQIRLQTTTTGKGSYCFEVPSGTYEVKPLLTAAEQAKGILLSPATRIVNIENQPVLTLNFVQTRVSVSGVIRTLVPNENHPGTLTVVLSHPSDPKLKYHVPVQGNQWQTIAPPGRYKVNVQQQPDVWCFHQTQEIEIGYTDLKGVEVVQSGYAFHVQTSHSVILNFISQSHTATPPLKLNKGSNRFCLLQPGVHVLRPSSCYHFETEGYTFDTAHPSPIILRAVEYKVIGQILIPQIGTSAAPASAIPVQISGAATQDLEAKLLEGKTQADFPDQFHNADGHKPVFVYEYSFWASIQSESDQFTITPQAVDKSSSLLYYPRSQSLSFPSQQCPEHVVPFVGRIGVYITGHVTPSVGGIAIVVTSSASAVQLETETAPDGSYRVGPLYDDEKYSVEAVHSGGGYLFVKENPSAKLISANTQNYNFRAIKLGSISASVWVKTAKGEQPLPGVLLSLSASVSGESYRNNNQTKENGGFFFSGLFPGQYFLRPLLKEYEFSPVSEIIEVADAADVVKRFTATRVSYSVFGNVASLNGQPEKGVVVEALEVASEQPGAKKKHIRHEDTITDEKGSYRLRGLVPDSRYKISLKTDAPSANLRLERGTPEHVVDVKREDITGIDFVAFRAPSRFDLTGSVNVEKGSESDLDSLEVVLTLANEPDKQINTTAVSRALNFFEFPQLSQDTYILTVRSHNAHLSPRTHKIEAWPLTVRLDKHSHVEPSFRAEVKPLTEEALQSNFLFLATIIIIVAVLIYKKQVLEAISVFVWSLPPSVRTPQLLSLLQSFGVNPPPLPTTADRGFGVTIPKQKPKSKKLR